MPSRREPRTWRGGCKVAGSVVGLSSGSSRPEGRLAGSEFPERRRAVAAGLTERKLDAFLVAFSPNLRYLTGFTGSNGNLLVTRGESILFTDPRYTIQAQSENGDCRIAIAKGRLVAGVAAAIAKLGLKRIGYEPARMTCDLYESLKSSLP